MIEKFMKKYGVNLSDEEKKKIENGEAIRVKNHPVIWNKCFVRRMGKTLVIYDELDETLIKEHVTETDPDVIVLNKNEGFMILESNGVTRRIEL